jgi:hypothetical protein
MICRPEGSIKTLYSIISVLGLRGIGILMTWSACDSSIRTRRLFARPITSRSELTAKETRGAGNANCTGPNSKMGVAGS